jgi:hypothetical protein
VKSWCSVVWCDAVREGDRSNQGAGCSVRGTRCRNPSSVGGKRNRVRIFLILFPFLYLGEESLDAVYVSKVGKQFS